MVTAQPHKSAFSLIELSIVLVILGLLVGGILAGQSLIRAAELRSISTESGRMLAAVQAFRDKYFYLPGDMTNATSFWGSLGSTGSDAVCQVLPATGTATCNGDGDGTFGINFGTISTQYELYRFWQHLANAGLIEGTYIGVTGSTIGTNFPPAKTGNSSYWSAFSGHSYGGTTTTYWGGSTSAYAGDYGRNGLQLRSLNASTTTSGSYPLTPQEAWNVDTKLDDASPANGKIISNKGNATNTNCTSTASVAAADPSNASSTYKLDNTAKDCWLFFRGYF